MKLFVKEENLKDLESLGFKVGKYFSLKRLESEEDYIDKRIFVNMETREIGACVDNDSSFNKRTEEYGFVNEEIVLDTIALMLSKNMLEIK